MKKTIFFDFKKKMYSETLNSNDVKRMQSIDSIETYTYGKSKDLVSEKENIKCNKHGKLVFSSPFL